MTPWTSPDEPASETSGEPPADIFGTPWGEVLRDGDAAALETTGVPSIVIPDGIPSIERER